MSGAGNRYVVVPTVTVLAVIKNRLGGAKKGHQLLKKKADALNMRFRQILKKIMETKEKMGTSLRESNFALTEAKYTAGDSVKHTIVDSVKVSEARRCKEKEGRGERDRPRLSQSDAGFFSSSRSLSSSRPCAAIAGGQRSGFRPRGQRRRSEGARV